MPGHSVKDQSASMVAGGSTSLVPHPVGGDPRGISTTAD